VSALAVTTSDTGRAPAVVVVAVTVDGATPVVVVRARVVAVVAGEASRRFVLRRAEVPWERGTDDDVGGDTLPGVALRVWVLGQRWAIRMPRAAIAKMPSAKRPRSTRVSGMGAG
jgi:hypothetical protein